MYRLSALLLAVTVVPGCSAINIILEELLDQLQPQVNETGSAKLIPFQSEEELVDYFSNQADARNDSLFGFRADLLSAEQSAGDSSGDGGLPPPDSALQSGGSSTGDDGAAAGDTDFSQTTIQVEGVDEPDVVKTDGQYVYVIDNGTLRIVRIAPPEQLAELATVTLQGAGRNIFLHDSRVVALTETGFFYGGGGILIEPVIDLAVSTEPVSPDGEDGDGKDVPVSGDDPAGDIAPDPAIEPEFTRPSTYVTIVDVSDPAAPAILSTTTMEGTPSASRMIDGVLHLVISNYQHYYFDVMPRLGRPGFEPTVMAAETILPRFSRRDAEGAVAETGALLTWREMFRPTDPDGFGVVSLVSLDVDADAALSAVGIVAQPGLVYSSLTAMYLTDTELNFLSDTRDTTDIYKFEYVGRGAVPVATGSVPGRVLNQYSLDEHAGHLRVATTTRDPRGFRFEPDNNVFVLVKAGDELEIVGSVTDIAPGETIQSARFIGDRGYLVTFELIDPFFTLDLADPLAPVVVGQLKVPGFSTFIVPIDADHLLTVGQYIPESGFFLATGVQLSVFDVTDFANPQLTALAVLGEETGASSEALRDPKAFTYFASQGLVALPISIYDDVVFLDDFVDGDGGTGDSSGSDGSTTAAGSDASVEPGGFDGVVVFRVDAEAGFTERGRISTRFGDASFYWSAFTRGLFIGDNAFAVTNHGIRGGPVADLTGQPFELLFEAASNGPIAIPQ